MLHSFIYFNISYPVILSRTTLVAFLILTIGLSGLTAQVKVSPEIGVSYAPFMFYSANTKQVAEGVDYMLGINGSVQLTDRFLTNLRISYVDREDFKWQDLCLCPDYLYSTFTHSDLNMELSLLYSISEAFDAGAGYTLVRLIDAEFFVRDLEQDFLWEYDNWNGGLHAMVVYHYRRFYARLTYARRFKPYDLLYLFSEGQDRFDLTVGYELFGGDLKGG